MHNSISFLQNLALVMCVAAATTIVFQRLRQPVVFGYLLAGMIIGPYLPIPLSVDADTVHTLSELGMILLMFGLGLEFSLRKLMRVGTTAVIIAVLQSSAMLLFGYLLGQALGWTQMESVYTGAAISICSTTIIVKAFAEQGARGKFTEIVFGVLIIQDLIAILLVAILTTVSTGSGVSASSIAITAARLVAFLAVLIGVGLLTIPRLIRVVVRLDRPETTLVASVGICFAAALLALNFGYSVALGAFIAGSLIAESGQEKVVETLILPVRDMFAAIFFVAVGMMINPVLVAEHWVAVLALTLVVILGNVIMVTIGAFLAGLGTRTAVQTGMSLSQIGEFSFIIAGVGLAAGAIRPFLYPVAVAVSAITTLTTPWLIRASGPVAAYADRKLPKPLQTFVSLYASWIEQIHSAPDEPVRVSRTRRLIRMILLDAVLIAAISIGVVFEVNHFTRIVTESFEVTAITAQFVFYAGATVVIIPLLIGLIRSARMLGVLLATRAIPDVEAGKIDLADAPRRALVVTLQLAIICVVGIPFIAITQPFVPPLRSGAVLLSILIVLGITLWRSATNLHGHTRAGAHMIVAALKQQMAPLPNTEINYKTKSPLTEVKSTLPGLGDPVCVRIGPSSQANGRTLAQLNLRGMTGATVLAITRGDEQITLPIGREQLHSGDLIALAGTQESVDAAVELLQ